MKNSISYIGFLIAGGLVFAFGLATANAQPTAHYVPGVEGLEAATLPPPGMYLRDYNYFYDADQINNGGGHEIKGADLHTFVYAQVFRPIWITDQKILGGNFAIDGFWPVVDTDLKVNTPAGTFDKSLWTWGDPFVGSTLSWHVPQFDYAIGLGEWLPGGAYAAQPNAKSGTGFYGTMLTAGATWYPDTEKTWSLSFLNRYEINSEQEVTHIVPGDVWTAEWGIAKELTKHFDVGLVGYYQQQTTISHGAGANRARPDVVAVGPEIGFTFHPHWIATARYEREVWASNRAEGNTCVITVTYRF